MNERPSPSTSELAAWVEAWLPRAQAVAQDLGGLFQRALVREVPDEIGLFKRDTASIRYLRRQRRLLPHRLLLFVYASRFDAAFASRLPGGLDGREVLERKSARLDQAFGALVRAADVNAGHHVVALMSGTRWDAMPLVWQVPADDPARTGFPRDAMWWLTFQYLCEVSRAIVAYAGMTALMAEELGHIRANPRLQRRLLLMDAECRLSRVGHDDQSWSLDDLPQALARIERRVSC